MKKIDANKWVRIWLFSGVVLIFLQVVIGGITRLTGSGLSITKWEIVTGTLPPLEIKAWEEAFDLYKDTPQYEKINKGLSLSEFKFIYFWEYFHRLWARLMGLAFVIPFAIFYFRKQIQVELLKRLGVVFLLAALVAVFGWIMVASGLVDRPWVNAYKLSLHLGLALLCMGYLFRTWMMTLPMVQEQQRITKYRNVLLFLYLAIIFQIMLGGMVSGMRAALLYPTWPDMNGAFMPGELLNAGLWTWDNFLVYDKSSFMPALIQFLHRNLAYVILVVASIFVYRFINSNGVNTLARKSVYMFLLLLFVQVTIGIITLILSKGVIPVFWGVVHQAVGVLLLMIVLWNYYLNSRNRSFE